MEKRDFPVELPNPVAILGAADRLVFGKTGPDRTAEDALEVLRPYISTHLAEGGRLHQVTRHMLGLFSDRPGARRWRQVLSTDATADGAGLEVLDRALAAVTRAAA